VADLGTDYLGRLPPQAQAWFRAAMGHVGSPYRPEKALISLAYGCQLDPSLLRRHIVAAVFGPDHVDVAMALMDRIIEDRPAFEPSGPLS
jgi:hypothetical protein